ncbi:MAG TPA: hypothetical protein VNA20_17900 [Frankiaceae bacterium]|nr:hypothetical protein [Frankiaceae bacterium]
MRIDASRLTSFGDAGESVFCLITSPELTDRFAVTPGPRYGTAQVIPFAGTADFAEFLATSVPQRADLLVVLPNVYFRSPTPAELGPHRKLAVMAVTSTPSSLESIAHFIRMGERTDPAAQERLADSIFSRGRRAERLVFVDEDYGTSAVFDHLAEELQWHEQGGYLDWGQQQLFPSGEVSVLPVDVFGQDVDRTFALDGEIALRGCPVVHSGTPSFLPADQERIFRNLASMRDAAVVVTVRDGVAVEFEATGEAARPAARTLAALADVDSRFGTLLEIGFGLNTGIELFPGNSAMNEVYGGVAGTIHFGFGLIPYTQYHIDLICPGTRVVDERGEPVFGTGAAHEQRGASA